MISAPLAAIPGGGAPLSGLIPVDPSFAALLLLGFLAAASAVLWWLGGLTTPQATTLDRTPVSYREAA